MSIDLRGFIYFPDSWGQEERWESKFSEYQVIYFKGLYSITTKEDDFVFFGNDNNVYMNLDIALNMIRLKAINEFFGDDIF